VDCSCTCYEGLQYNFCYLSFRINTLYHVDSARNIHAAQQTVKEVNFPVLALKTNYLSQQQQQQQQNAHYI